MGRGGTTSTISRIPRNDQKKSNTRIESTHLRLISMKMIRFSFSEDSVRAEMTGQQRGKKIEEKGGEKWEKKRKSVLVM